MQNNILIVTKDIYLDKAKEANIQAFLFPFKDYCVGFTKCYSLEEINEENSYLYINRVLNNQDIDNLKEIFKNIKSNIKGIFFQDIGLIPVLKDLNIEKILFSHHLTTNYKSLNYYLEYIDSAVISTDITVDEMNEIIDKSNKSLCIYKFGLVPIMYSRRSLVSNFKKFYDYKEDINLINEPISNKDFRIKESKYGTVIFPKTHYFNNLINNNNIKYYIINPEDLNEEEFDNLLLHLNDGKFNFETTEGFLHTKTIYKLPPKEEVK